MRIGFYELFAYENGMLRPKATLRIGPATLSPGASFSSGVSYGGINLFQYLGKDLEVEKLPDGVYNITKIYT